MDAYFARTSDGILDLVVRATNADDAMALLGNGADLEVGELRLDITGILGVPEVRGVHRGVLWNWLRGPTNLFGELPPN